MGCRQCLLFLQQTTNQTRVPTLDPLEFLQQLFWGPPGGLPPSCRRPSRKGCPSTAATTHRRSTASRAHGYTPPIRARPDEIKLKARAPGWCARRWVVEATHSWLNRNWGILIRWCKKDENHLALLQFAAGLIAFKNARRALLAAAQPG
jgi:hypothetical protein